MLYFPKKKADLIANALLGRLKLCREESHVTSGATAGETHFRPDTTMSWLLSPLRIFCILAWRNYKFQCLGLLFLALTLLFLLLLFYSMPGALSRKIINVIG
ncbi:hypothetical protein COCON_G00099260 [Conger conger]|uniref:Ferlin C-terminal domain-containing protein n=1 Tax=Conger conger TaxID=82655 RepID=A0A9Q1I0Y5_CONCO|nr:hypothetical protein COCON_G00099260 [Conger conger]